MIEDATFVYRRTQKSGRVERKAKADYEVYGWIEDMEKVDHDVHDFRKHWERLPRLDEYLKSDIMTNNGKEKE